MRRCSRIVVKGKVQGVSFRDYVKRHAQKLNIEGTIQNESDGSVVISACGASEKIDLFVDYLYKGSPKSKIEAIIEEPLPATKDFRGIFRIIGTR